MPRVLIVDDDRITVSLLKTFLELDDFEVVQAPNPDEGLKVAKDHNPDILIVDYHLSDEIDGAAFVRTIRKQADFETTPIIMTSGLNRRDEAESAGANRFLIKPFDPIELVRVINELLEVESGE